MRLSAPLIAFVLLGMLAPTVAVFWFMNEAATSQAEAARRNVMDAYRGQLTLLRDKLEEHWRARADALNRGIGRGLHADTARLRTASGADAVILLDASGKPVYPKFAWTPSQWPDASMLLREPEHAGEAAAFWERAAVSQKEPSRIAVAVQAQVRSLIRAGNKPEALAAIRKWFINGPAARAVDASDRLIAADEQLLALKLVNSGDESIPAGVSRLLAMINDFEGAPMRAAQRLFLAAEIKKLSPTASLSPELESERLALEYLEAERSPQSRTGLQQTAASNVWRLASANGSVVALYRTATVVRLGEQAASAGQAASTFHVHPPGVAAGADAVALGPSMPGWQMSAVLNDPRPVEDAARRRRFGYLLFGSCVIAAVAVSGSFAGHALRQQMRLARLKTDLVAAVSHELRTPLASMSLLLETLLDEPLSEPKKTREYLELMAGENERLMRLVTNFLTFSRIDRGRQTFHFEAMAPADVAEEAAASISRRLVENSCAFEVDVPRTLAPVRADRDALATVLLNLLDNAVKYTGEVKKIALRAAAVPGGVSFSVTDNGMGIAASEQRKIFRRFYQVDRRLARESGGCGLGLSIVDELVRAHGGKVSLTSEPGKGSTFTVLIPFWKGSA
mgnify:CR=1 FL=1